MPLSTIIMKRKRKLNAKRPPYLAGLAVPVGVGTGQEIGAGGQAPTPTVEAAATVGCPDQ